MIMCFTFYQPCRIIINLGCTFNNIFIRQLSEIASFFQIKTANHSAKLISLSTKLSLRCEAYDANVWRFSKRVRDPQ